MRHLLFFLVPLLLTGCVAGAVGAAGANAEKDADVVYYLKANEVEPRIRKAMRDRTIVKGMTPPQVRLTMGAKTDYSAYPNDVKKTGNGEVWVYENTDPMTPATYRIDFDTSETVVDFSQE